MNSFKEKEYDLIKERADVFMKALSLDIVKEEICEYDRLKHDNKVKISDEFDLKMNSIIKGYEKKRKEDSK